MQRKGKRMKRHVILRTIFAVLTVQTIFGQTSDAFAYACNDRHYVNSSSHWEH